MKTLPNLLTTAFFVAMTAQAFAQLVINEVDADTPGSDSAEFIELYDGGTGNTSLDGYVLVLFNGSNDTSYQAYDLDGFSTDTNGYFVLGNTGINGVQITVPGNTIQNGADAVALYLADATDFPNGTAPNTTNLVDALVYGTNDGDDTGLLTALGQPLQNDESANGENETESSSRTPNGSGAFGTLLATPGAENGVAAPDLDGPEVTSLSPADDALDVSLSPTIQISFNEVVEAGTGTIQLIRTSDSAVIENFDVSSDVTVAGNNVSLSLSAPLDSGTAYHFIVPAGAFTDTSSNDFDGILTADLWNFETAAPDTTAPGVTALSPAAGSGFVAVDSSLSLTFDEPIQAGTGNITIFDADDNLIEAFDVSSAASFDTNSVTITPSAPLAVGTSFYVLVDNGAITDASSNAFAGISSVTEWTFETVSASTPGPDINGFSPAPGAIDVSTTPTLRIQFDEEIFKLSGNLVIKRSSDNSVVQTYPIADSAVLIDPSDSSALLINVGTPLDNETSYYVEVDAGYVEDFDFNGSAAISGSSTWTFTTAAGLPTSDILITQYYEGSGFDKYIEISNVSGSPITLDGYVLSLFGNASTESWKSGAQSGGLSLAGITLEGGESYLLKNSGAVNPGYAAAGANAADNSVINFNGDDSIVLYLDANGDDSLETTEIADAVSFTDDGNEGANTSFYRTSNDVGYNLADGSTILDFEAATNSAGPWQQIDTATVNSTSDQANPIALQFKVLAVSPVLDSFVISGDASNTSSPLVLLEFGTSGGSPTEYQVSEDSEFTGATWLPIAVKIPYELSAGSGEKTVYVKVRNASGESAVLSDTITRDDFVYLDGLIFTQSHEEVDNGDKYVEITNTTGAPIDLTNYVIGRFSNTIAEDWKITGAAQPTDISLAAAGTLGAGETMVLANSSALTPIDASTLTAPDLASGALNFNGNDSLVLFNDANADGNYDPSELVDALSFTESGAEGADVSLVRTTGGQGFAFTLGSSILDAPGIWSVVDIATAEAAVENVDNAHLGTYPGGGVAPDDYDSWIDGFPGVGSETAFGDDPDKDGIVNGLENVFGTDPSDPLDAVAVSNTLALANGDITFEHQLAADVASDITVAYEWSTDLSAWNDSGDSVGGTTVTFTTEVIATASNGTQTIRVTADVDGAPGEVFVRAAATLPIVIAD